MTVTTHEKGKTLEQSGGMVWTSNIWLGPVIPYLKEIRDFDQRYLQKLQGSLAFSAADAQQMATAMAMYPAMKEMFGKIQTEKVNMDGTEILTITIMESVKSAEQMHQQQQNPDEAESKPSRGRPRVHDLQARDARSACVTSPRAEGRRFGHDPRASACSRQHRESSA